MADRARYSPLLSPDWRYVEKLSLEEFTRADWETLERQRRLY